MSALFLFVIVALWLCIGLAYAEFASPMVAAVIFVGGMLWFGVTNILITVSEYRSKARKNRDAFLREVIAAHKRQREASQAGERA